MNNIQIDNFIPPFRSAELSYFESLTNILTQYVEYIEKYIETDPYVITKIENINSTILSSIEDLKKANSQRAYEQICKIIIEEKNCINWPTYIMSNNRPLVRLRYSESDLVNRKDIFHIPYSLRHKIAQQRFSITGVPCLYLSGCAFTAWLELNKPNFSNLWCSGFRANKDIKVLDLAMRLDSIINEEDNIGKLIFYPFVIASSYSTKHPQGAFKEEYIISNILLQAIINNTDFKGIRYFSTKINNYKSELAWMATNIVLPACNDSDCDYDRDLALSLSLTYPQPCSTLIHSPNKGGLSCMAMPMNEFHEQECISNGNSHHEPRIFEFYTSTQFFNIDGYLRSDLTHLPIEM